MKFYQSNITRNGGHAFQKRFLIIFVPPTTPKRPSTVSCRPSSCTLSVELTQQLLVWSKLFIGFHYPDCSAFLLLQRELGPLPCLSGEALNKEVSWSVVSKLFHERIVGGQGGGSKSEMKAESTREFSSLPLPIRKLFPRFSACFHCYLVYLDSRRNYELLEVRAGSVFKTRHLETKCMPTVQPRES